MAPSQLELIATVCFGLALTHSFLVKKFMHLASKFPEGSVGENFFHLLGEVEVVFGLWAGVFVVIMRTFSGQESLVHYMEGLNFTEPLFVFAIMTVCATRPVLDVAAQILKGFSRLLPLNRAVAFFFATIAIGPLLGSFITEPAAMTVVALILRNEFYERGLSKRFMYTTIGTLFVNISIGGVLTPYAAPPVLMVAEKWGWDMGFMLNHFGWKAALAVFLNAAICTTVNFKELIRIPATVGGQNNRRPTPAWVMGSYLIFLVVLVANSHTPEIFLGVFLFFLGLATVLQEYNDALRVREALLVAFFLAGLVVLGAMQRWWLEPLLASLETRVLFAGATALTAITDNAALTYLGSQVPTISDASKYGLVAGAVAGGGLTVIANAPNPAGFSILSSSFGKDGISPMWLFVSAIVPTWVAVAFLMLPPGI